MMSATDIIQKLKDKNKKLQEKNKELTMRYKNLSDEYERLSAERDVLLEANHSVAVCKNHVKEIISRNGCVVCDLFNLEDRVSSIEYKLNGLSSLSTGY